VIKEDEIKVFYVVEGRDVDRCLEDEHHFYTLKFRISITLSK
jgi:hypothetical protein